MRAPNLVLTVAILAWSSWAHAQPGMTQPPLVPPANGGNEFEVREHSYRGLLLGTSAGALGLFLLGGLSEGENGRDTEASEKLFAAGMIGFVASGPIVHATQGNLKNAGGSLALRLVLPAAGMAIGIATADCDELLCELDRAGPGWLVGAAVATGIDAIWLAKTSTVVEERPRVVPYAGPTKSGGIIGLATTY